MDENETLFMLDDNDVSVWMNGNSCLISLAKDDVIWMWH